MIRIIITNASTNYVTQVELEPRWMRLSMCKAIDLLFFDFASETTASVEVTYTGVEDDNLDHGVIVISVDQVSKVWQDKLAEVLSQAKWDFKTRAGYGEFIETLNTLRTNKALIKGEEIGT